MQKNFSFLILDGYGSGETDFSTRLAQSDPQVQSAFDEYIIQPLLVVLNSAGECAVLTIEGHSDRVDSEGLNREQRRQMELDASNARAGSADAAVKQMLRARYAGNLPDDFDNQPNIAILSSGFGAAVLVEKGDSITWSQRLANRRIQMYVTRFTPD
jgi:flagellar motor protein MotB